MWRLFNNNNVAQEESVDPEETSESVGKDTPESKKKKKEKKQTMTEQEWKSLMNKRGQVKGKVSRIWNAIQVAEGEELTISQQQLRVHQRNVEKYYGEYNDVHDKITPLAQDKHLDALEAKLVEFEDVYNKTQVQIEILLDAHAKAAAQQVNPRGGLGQPGQPQYVIHQQSLKAPLPSFNGKYENWPKFKSMFLDLMRNSPDSDAVKLFHLEKSLVGEAEGILDAKTIQDNNYEQAWRILEERFENKRRIIDIHIEGILLLKKVVKKSSKELRELISECTRHIENLSFHGQELTGVSELIVVHILSSALDEETRELWEGSIEHGELPKYQETIDFLKKRCLVLERCEVSKPVVSTTKPVVSKPSSSVKSSTKVSATVSTNNEIVCELCGGSHLNFKCNSFKNMSVAQRYAKVKQAKVCFNCLRKGHRSSACTSERSCFKCSGKHHSLLHPEEEQSNQSPQSKQEDKVNGSVAQAKGSTGGSSDSVPVEPSSSASVTTSCFSGGMLQSTKQVFLQTAIIDVVDKYGRLHPCRTLLDSGSQAHILSESMARVLGLPTMKCNVTVVGANAVKTQAKKGVQVDFSSRYSSFRDRIECLVSDRPTGIIPAVSINVREWNIPSGIQLADPRFFEPNEVDLILASNYVWELLRTNEVKLPNGTTSLRETDLGWIVTGTFDPYIQVSQCILLSNVAMLDPLQDAIEKFWTVEEVADSSPHSSEETEVESHFVETHRRDDTGRFVVQMPFRDTVSELDDNRELALKRFLQLEKRLSRDPELKRQYAAFIEEYVALGHCKEIREEDDDPRMKKYYLPHHAVLKPSSSSTKLRVVFNASSKSTKYSLNDVLKTGPTVQSDLFSIVLRFCCYVYAFSGDVAKMYRQVGIDESQTTFLRIFWRKNPSDPIQVLELTTVTYGTASAPYLATRCLVQLAEDEKERFPTASQILKKDVYVDDVLSGADTEDEAVELQREITTLLAEGGFPIRKWCSNSQAVLKNIPEEDKEKLISFQECSASEATKALGVLWDPRNDNLLFVVGSTEEDDKVITKRHVLSTISKLFDPLGLVSPVIVIAKTIMQRLWAGRMNWDDELEGELLRDWNAFQRSMPELNQISVPRCVVSSGAVRMEIHGFADASLKAYGACIYLRCVMDDGSANTRLLCAKSRVAPLKEVTIPRMELLAALLLSRLVVKVIETIQLKPSAVILWSDSQIVLAWLRRAPGTLEVFVRNRVVQINDLTADYAWKYVGTSENPADIVSRGQLPAPLSGNSLWWHGPEFLKKPEYVVEKPPSMPESEIPELKTIVVVDSVCVEHLLPVFTKFSNFRKLQRVIAYVQRFVHNCRSRVNNQSKIVLKYITIPETKKALKCIVKVIQMTELPEDIQAAERNESSKHLANLSPILDSEGLLRVGGRLENASLPFETKHQLIMPAHPVTDSLIRSLHVENMHIGPTGLVAIVRQRFWLLRGRSTVRKITRSCLKCFRVKPSGIQQFMGNLPEERVNVAAPFEYTGVDYAGPVTVKQGKYRPKLVKGYIAVFVCMATKNIHLELVSELTTEAFIAALERFINRRGLVRKMFSDNGTNFVGASHELHELYQQLESDVHRKKINDVLLPKEIEWHFIPPRAPNFGGLWEAGVKSTKTQLRRTLQNAVLNFEEFTTALTHVEAILNSRPLFHVSENPNDPLPITPAHLQIGRPLQGIPKPSCLGTPDNRLSRWRYLDKLKEHFWGRWSREYLTTLQTRDGTPIQRITLDHDFTDDSEIESIPRGLRLDGNGQRIEIKDIEDTTELSMISITRTLRTGQIVSDLIHTNGKLKDREIQWYGGPEQMEQFYPVQRLRFEDYAYVPKELHSAAIVERYWLNSAGVFFYVEKEVPLFIDQDEESLRLTAKKELPYYTYDESFVFNYRIGVAKDVKEAHLKAVDKVLNKPVGIPDERMVRNPIWSTWVRYRRPINQQTVLDFAKEINDYGFKNAQMDIDDFWENCYGSLVFNSVTFPNVTEMTEQLKEMGFRVTLWIHPFINKNCQPWYTEALTKGFLVKSHNEDIGYNTKWWNSGENEASYINFNNHGAVEWFRQRLVELREQGIDSFKFDAGETSWAPEDPDVEGPKALLPASMTTSFVRMCAEFGPMIEIRTGWATQDLPVFVRMLDFDTRWGKNNGLQSLIPTLLQMNLNGYPFVLPDMIGGNMYGSDILTKELFIRWLQANTFMPSMQFSKSPWDIDEESITITKRFTMLHEEYSDYILQRMRLAVAEGIPVNPPIWWLDPDDEEALKISDEYLLGEDILVAPVLTEFATKRDVYLPKGTWRDGNTNQVYEGGRWLYNHLAPMDTLPYFIKTTFQMR